MATLACVAVAMLAAIARAAGDSKPAHPLAWDPVERIIEAKPGEGGADFQFSVTNTSDKPVTIQQIRPSCGCTIVEMPHTPWVLAPGAHGAFSGSIDFRGKEGTVNKTLYVNSDAGTQTLAITVKIPAVDETARKANQMIAQADRSAIFRGDCAKCHVEPGVGRSGAELFTAVCGVCHFAARRASMVPDLFVAKQHRDAEFWRKWISEGKEGTLMPAWSKEHGGPFTREQIDSLVQFAASTLPADPPAKE